MIITGLIVWPNIFKASTIKGYEDNPPKFRATILVPKGSKDGDAIKNTVNSLISSEFDGEPPNYLAVADGDAEANPDFDGYWVVKAAAAEDRPPQVVDGNVEPIIDPGKVRGGDNVRVDVNFYAFKKGRGGINCNLNNVQWISKGDKPIGSFQQRAEDVFEKIPGAESASTAQASDNSQGSVKSFLA